MTSNSRIYYDDKIFNDKYTSYVLIINNLWSDSPLLTSALLSYKNNHKLVENQIVRQKSNDVLLPVKRSATKGGENIDDVCATLDTLVRAFTAIKKKTKRRSVHDPPCL